MMTIHGSKGLEFKNVYIVGMEEDLFPSQMMLSSREDLEEERRLFYVAMTRAENKLHFSYALSRYRFGRLKTCEPSRFLEEVNKDFLKFEDYVQAYGSKPGNPHSKGFGSMPQQGQPLGFNSKPLQQTTGFNSKPLGKSGPSGYSSSGLKDNLKRTAQKKPVSKHTPSTNFVASAAEELKEGQRVEHPKFGFGKIEQIDTSGADKKAKVNFDNLGEKTLLLSFAKLMIHEH